MARVRKQVSVLAYNGLDGACAAAMVLLAHPHAEVRTASARGIGDTLAELVAHPPAEVHVCGLGVWCAWEAIAEPIGLMKRKHGTRVHWYCGRGYLDGEREQLATLAEIHFLEVGTNTAAVAQALGLTDRLDALMLTDLARCDHNLKDPRPDDGVTPGEREWMDLIEATLAQYFKYQERGPYISAIRRLATGALSKPDRDVIEEHRRTGAKYVLHGRSMVMKRLRTRIKLCAEAERHVLILGESGVGKEHAAQLIREGSRRAMGPFIAVNCALYAGNAALANSDLFGHVRGAFTGAVRDRKGKFVEADGGMLYLDEIGDLPLEVQAKLLRVLEDGLVTPEGADTPRPRVSVRILAATNKPLPVLIRRGEFRDDLFHRLATLRVDVPPLRERMGDLKTIVEHRLAMLEREGYARRFSEADYQALRGYSWPGNVRQLLKLVDRAVLLGMAPREVIAEESALGELVSYPTEDTAIREDGVIVLPQRTGEIRPMAAVLRDYARHAWEACDRNYTHTAKLLEISPNTLRYTHLGEKKR
ncbi:sigma 54-interacting transcriptional regulator [Roseovarius pacificus]|uniref:sigma 54-interacting transcriptional regulator n=1 Tax=Roseovarius pacificus TaxID=337701 RepID=UPI002A1896BD|nr:sigma 54-interacting transcriptional regulator [Roseovarius pacificus]